MEIKQNKEEEPVEIIEANNFIKEQTLFLNMLNKTIRQQRRELNEFQHFN